MMKTKSITVKVDESTYKWLSALAKANSNSQLNQGTVSAAELLRNAAFCFADYAGRRDGSWEADAGRNLLMSAGYQEMIKWDKRERLSAWEEKRNAAWRKAHPIKPVI